MRVERAIRVEDFNDYTTSETLVSSFDGEKSLKILCCPVSGVIKFMVTASALDKWDEFDNLEDAIACYNEI
jgi:hypothetical protein